MNGLKNNKSQIKPFCIYGPFGSGKTVLLHELRVHLEKPEAQMRFPVSL